MGRAAAGEARRDGADFEGGSPPARKNCSGSSGKRAASPTATAAAAAGAAAGAAAAAAAESRPGPRDPAAGEPAARRRVRRLGAGLAGRCRSSPGAGGRRCARVSGRAGSGRAAPGGSGGARRRSERGPGGGKRAGAAG